MRPVPWARTIRDLRYCPAAWGDRTIAIAASGGTHLLILRRGTLQLSLWVPRELAPQPGQSFGLYLHADRSFAARSRAAEAFRRTTSGLAAAQPTVLAHADRQAAMLYIHDLTAAGLSLREIASELLDPPPDEWRLSSERSDLRRLADAAREMVAGGYRRLLGSQPNL